jgi:tetratricopeptide (TPR) repeat protein
MEKKDYHACIGWFDKALSINDEDPEVWAYLGEFLLQLDLRGEAYLSYMHALSLKPDQADVLASIGNIAFDTGNYEKALGFYQAAALVDESLPGLNLFFALVYAKLGMEELSAEFLAKAMEVDPEAGQLYHQFIDETDTETDNLENDQTTDAL